jgi:hypothetical protein
VDVLIIKESVSFLFEVVDESIYFTVGGNAVELEHNINRLGNLILSPKIAFSAVL